MLIISNLIFLCYKIDNKSYNNSINNNTNNDVIIIISIQI